MTDGATFAWLCDVFVLPAHRGRGLATRDAHALYAKFGWQPVEAGRFMRITRPYALAE